MLVLYLRRRLLDFERASAIQTEAEALLAEREYDVGSLEVLSLAASSGCAAYDREFVALAQFLAVPLVTMDAKILRKFRSTAVSLTKAVR